MPFIKVHFSSPHNIGVQGEGFFEVLPEQLDENGDVPAELLDEIWQEAVNEFMADTYVKIVESEDE